MTPEVLAYLDKALEYIEANSVLRDRIDWPTLRQQAVDLVTDAQTVKDTYPAIEFILKSLGDHHSFFHRPEQEQERLTGIARRIGVRATHPGGMVYMVFDGSPAQQANIEVGDHIVTLNGQVPLTLTPQQFNNLLLSEQVDLLLQPKGQSTQRTVSLQATSFDVRRVPQGRRLTPHIGYLELPELPGSPEHKPLYMAQAQRLLREIDQSAVCGWVLDLRRNGGGNMWPMLAGVGSLLGEGQCLAMVSPWESVPIFYREGRVFAQDHWEERSERVEAPYQLHHPNPPVAVLTSPSTSSSGEFVALAFRERPRTRSFGEPTYGVPTGNVLKQLPDGATIALTAYWGADRAGNVFQDSLLPDQPVKVDWTCFGREDDPVLRVALQWLQTEEGCR